MDQNNRCLFAKPKKIERIEKEEQHITWTVGLISSSCLPGWRQSDRFFAKLCLRDQSCWILHPDTLTLVSHGQGKARTCTQFKSCPEINFWLRDRLHSMTLSTDWRIGQGQRCDCFVTLPSTRDAISAPSTRGVRRLRRVTLNYFIVGPLVVRHATNSGRTTQ